MTRVESLNSASRTRSRSSWRNHGASGAPRVLERLAVPI
mgnify:CR=1 FL=1